MNKEIVISVKTILVAFVFALVAYFLYRLGPIIGYIIIAFLLMISLEPLVKLFMRITFLNKPVSRGAAVVITYLLFIASIIGIVTIGLPPVLVQAQKLVTSLIGLAKSLSVFSDKIDLTSVLPQVSNLSGNLINTTFSIFSNVTTVITIVIFSVYMSLDWEKLKRKFLSFFSGEARDRLGDLLSDIETQVGSWVKGELILMSGIGLASFVALQIIGVPYPLALALISGILEAVPILGPLFASVLAGTIAFADNPAKGLAIIVAFAIIQQLENNIVVPKVMQRVSGFSPFVILLALMVGSTFFGILGAVLAVPMTMIMVVVVRRFVKTYPF